MSKPQLTRQAGEYDLQQSIDDMFALQAEQAEELEPTGPVAPPQPTPLSPDSATGSQADEADIAPVDVEQAVKYLTDFLSTDASMFSEELADVGDVAFSISQMFQITPCPDLASFSIVKQMRLDGYEAFNSLSADMQTRLLYVGLCRLFSTLEKKQS